MPLCPTRNLQRYVGSNQRLRGKKKKKTSKFYAVVFSFSQEVHRILCNPTVHYSVQNSPSPVFILSQVFPLHGPPSYFFLRSILILSFHILLNIKSGLYFSGFPTKTLYALLLSHIRATYLSTSLSSIWSTEQYLLRSKTTEIVSIQFPPFSCHLLCLRIKNISGHPTAKHLRLLIFSFLTNERTFLFSYFVQFIHFELNWTKYENKKVRSLVKKLKIKVKMHGEHSVNPST